MWLFIGLAHTNVGPELGRASTDRGLEVGVLSLGEQNQGQTNQSVRCHKNQKKNTKHGLRRD